LTPCTIEPFGDNLRECLDEVKNKCKDLMSQVRVIGGFKYYIAHDQEHLKYVWKNAEKLTFNGAIDVEFLKTPYSHNNGHSPLNDVEKFILGSSCYTHDLGMLKIVPDGEYLLLEDYEKSEDVREKHASEAPSMITKYMDDLVENNKLIWINNICRLHGSDILINDKFRKVSLIWAKQPENLADIDEEDWGLVGYARLNNDTFIRPALLSAILRLADALVYSRKHTLTHMEIIRMCVKKLEDIMSNQPHVFVESYSELMNRYKNNGEFRKVFKNSFDKIEIDEKVLPFLYKQIQEYWKHEIVRKVNILHIGGNEKCIIEIQIMFDEQLPEYPKFIKNGTEQTIKEVVKKKLDDEIDAVVTIFDAYGATIKPLREV